MPERLFTVSRIGRITAEKDGFLLTIDPAYRGALPGLDGFSHVNVLWWCDQVDVPELRRRVECEKPYRKGPAKLGLFATRSPIRPNPIALTTTPILSIDFKAGTVRVPFIDALDGTPIVDLKPYHPCADRVRSARVPEWCSHWPQWYEDSAGFDWQSEFVNAR